jgi:hypothetical protein
VRFAILGSGFGLYGYLPALIRCGQSVVLPERYRERFQLRQELTRFAKQVEWVTDEVSAVNRASAVVIALRPAEQTDWIRKCVSYRQITRLLLEKPLAPAPSEALSLQTMLCSSRKLFRIGYSLCDAQWTVRLKEFVVQNPDYEINVSWRFLAHHFRQDSRIWKQFDSAGGGAIRFYGIQLIAVLASLGYCFVSESKSYGRSVDEPERWIASILGDGLPICRILIDSRCNTAEFSIQCRSSLGQTKLLADLRNPFGENDRKYLPDGLDGRVGVLEDLVMSILNDAELYPSWYPRVVDLWSKIEAKNDFYKIAIP